MNASRCVRCGTYWAFTSGNHDSFTAITKFCPTCIAALPRLDWSLVR